MEEIQSTPMAPLVKVAHIPLQQAADQQRMYLASRPLPSLPRVLPNTPLPQSLSYRQPDMPDVPAMLGRQLLLQRLQTFRPAALLPDDETCAFPILKLAATAGQKPEKLSHQSSQAGIPRNPPYSIPGYFSSKTVLQEPGAGEALLGCGTLLFVSMVILAILYYLSL